MIIMNISPAGVLAGLQKWKFTITITNVIIERLERALQVIQDAVVKALE